MKYSSEYEAMTMLDLPDDERVLLSTCFAAVTGNFAALEQIDTKDVQPLVTVLDSRNVLREDVAEKLITRDEVMENAPEKCDGYFQVPETL